jgi:hypothetical protein
MYVSENYQWCGESYFAVAAISIGDILPHIPRQSVNPDIYKHEITSGVN